MATKRSESGFFTVWVLGLCLFLFALGALGVDLWHAFSERRELDYLADGAATAGASQIDLAEFQKAPSVIALNDNDAIAAAQDYVASASADAKVKVEGQADVRIVRIDNAGPGEPTEQIRVTLRAKTPLLISQILVSDEDFTISTTASAEPRIGN